MLGLFSRFDYVSWLTRCVVFDQVIRREVEKESNVDGGELLGKVEEGDKAGRVADSAPKRMVVAGAVEEDLYKVPRPLIYQKPRKVVD